MPATLTISVIREDAAPGQLVVQVEEARARGREAWVLVRVLTAQLARCVRYDERAALLLVEIDDPGDDDGVARLRRRRPSRVRCAAACAARTSSSRSATAASPRCSSTPATPAAMAVARGVHAAVEETAVAGATPLGAAVGVCAFDATATAARIMAEAESALLRARRTNGVAASGAA